jgi:spore germination protein YaaH
MPYSSLPLQEPVLPVPEPQQGPAKWIVILGIAAVLALAATLYWFLPGFRSATPDIAGEPTLIWQGKEITDQAVIKEDDRLYFSVPLLQSLLDPHLFWDAEQGYLAVTTKDQLIQMNSSQLTWYLNQEPVELRFPLLLVEGKPYLELEPLQFIYRLEVDYIPDTNRVIVKDTKEPVLHGEIAGKKVWLRQDDSLRAPRITDLQQGEQVVILAEQENWFQVETDRGLIGYLPEKEVTVRGVAWTAPPQHPEKPPWKPLGGKVNLTWEQVTRRSANPKPEVISSLDGINAYSPTWFHLADAQGNITNYADPHVVSKAHEEGMQVWALFSNGFDPEMTAAFLKDPEARDRAIRQLAIQAELYNLDGINIDFENIAQENKELLVQFVRELAPVLREQGLVVSMDVTFISNSSYWSLIYDRQALGEAVDYLMVMAYDEHWASSPVPGSVASLPWVEKGLLEILKEVPAEKLILGLPLYARLWSVSPDGVTSKAWSMNQTQKWLKENRLEPVLDPATGQHFAELEQDGNHYLLWLEDETSIQQRVELVHKYGLAGVAAWQRGFAKTEIWPALAGYLSSKPAGQ